MISETSFKQFLQNLTFPIAQDYLPAIDLVSTTALLVCSLEIQDLISLEVLIHWRWTYYYLALLITIILIILNLFTFIWGVFWITLHCTRYTIFLLTWRDCMNNWWNLLLRRAFLVLCFIQWLWVRWILRYCHAFY